MLAAAKAGYRHFDCAAIYGNEHEVGDALAAVMAAGLKRSELFVTSKLWNTDHAPARVRAAAEKSAADLRCGSLDLYLMHWPVAGNVGPEVNPPIFETWAAMEGLVDAGACFCVKRPPACTARHPPGRSCLTSAGRCPPALPPAAQLTRRLHPA